MIGDMKKITSVICDLDGTLLNSFKDVTKVNHNTLSALDGKGVVIGLASGRDISQIEDNLERWGLDDTISFIIGSNGCEYKNLDTGRYVRQGFMSTQVLSDLNDWLKASGLVWGVKEDGHMFWNHFTPFSFAGSVMDGLKASYGGFHHLKGIEIRKIVLLGSPSKVTKAIDTFHFEGLKMIPVSKYSAEIVSASVSKYEGLKRVLEDFPLCPEDILSFGDDYNDIELVSQTFGIAMKNAIDPVILAAQDRTKYAGPQDGVAYHLNAMMLSGHYSFEKPSKSDLPNCGSQQTEPAKKPAE